jgi:sucrose-6-phosphate hydrolase SacC (GH32 family)
MWYSSYFNGNNGLGGIGLAESKDGVSWRREHNGKPVLPLGPDGAFDDGQVFGPSVLHDGKQYLMWYTGDAGIKHKSGIFYYQIGLATSPDGVTWTRANGGEPVLGNGPEGSVDEIQSATPCVLREGDGYRMWYAAWAPIPNHTICVARSADGVTWTRENDGKPVEGLHPSIAYGHSVARVGDRYVMLYMALSATRSLYGATSTDGRRWTMLNDGKPVLTTGSGSDFDANIVGHPDLLVEGDTLRAWYTGYQTKPGAVTNWDLRIGLAEAPLAPTTAPAGGQTK